MTVGASLAIVIPMATFMLGTVITVCFFMSNELGGRIDQLGRRTDQLESSLGDRIDRLDDQVQDLRADVAVLKAAQ